MKLFHFFIILCLPLFFSDCKTTKYSPESFPESQIIFGDGGGFSGVVTEYILLDNGQFFKKSSLNEKHEELEPLKKTEAKEIYERLAELRLHKFDINHPGNLYYFLRFTNEELDHTITWGAGDYNLREDIMSFYKDLRALLKDRKTFGEREKKDK